MQKKLFWVKDIDTGEYRGRNSKILDENVLERKKGCGKESFTDGKMIYSDCVCFEDCLYNYESVYEDIWEIMQENSDGDFEEQMVICRTKGEQNEKLENIRILYPVLMKELVNILEPGL